jgi:outer membrane protein TolC
VTHYFWVFPAACGLFAIVATLAPLPAILRQKNQLQQHQERLQALGSAFDIERAQRSIERARADIEAMPALIDRAKAALKTLQNAGKVLGMRRARTAIALAALSIRALTATLRARA